MAFSPFARFVTASGFTNLADGVGTIAWAWLASLLTRDPLLIAMVPLALRMPWFLFAVPAGVVTDRMDRRQLILWMDSIRGFAFGLLALLIWMSLPLAEPPATGFSNPNVYWGLLVGGLAVGTAEVFRDNAAQTMLPGLVPSEQLERANGRLWSIELVGNALLGPAFGAFLIAVALPLPFFLNTIAYLVAFWLVLCVAGQFRPASTADRNMKRELAEGIRFLMQAPLLRTLAWVTGVWNLLFTIVMIALVLHVQENLGLSAPGYGLVLAAGALGGIAGGFYGENIAKRLGPGRAAQWMLACSPPAFLGIAYAPGPLSLALVLAVFEFTGIVWNTVSVAYRQRKVPDTLLGRVNSLYRLLAWGMIPIGLLVSGLIVRGAATLVPRDVALEAPFYVAAIGAIVLLILSWGPIGNGFRRGD